VAVVLRSNDGLWLWIPDRARYLTALRAARSSLVRDDSGIYDSVSQCVETQFRILAARFARVLKNYSLREQRVQGRPGAGCTRGLVCSVESTRVSHHRQSRNTPAFPAQWCYGCFVLSPVSMTLLVTVTGRIACTLSTSPGAPGPHDLAVRDCIARLTMLSRPSHPAPNTRDDRDAPLSEDAGCAYDKRKFLENAR
jgi:hypothetical protein